MEQELKFVVYYRLFYGIDAHANFTSIEAMKREVGLHKDEDFEYLNACIICDDGSEEIVYTGYEEIMNAS